MRTASLLLCFTAAAVWGYRNYEGYKVLLVTPSNKLQLDFLYQLMLTQPQFDFWQEPKSLGHDVAIMTSPEDFELLQFELNIQGLHVTVLYDNIQRLIDAEKLQRRSKPVQRDYDYDDFSTYEEYMEETDALAAACPPDVTCTVSVIGQSVEGRDIKLLNINTGAPRDYFMDGCIHAREWLACATLMKLVNHMITNTSDPEAERVMKTHNWHIVPIVNPDGYVFSHTDERLWRKSRNVNPGSDCLGTDLNRNHEYNWNTGGTSTDPCSDIFHGNGAASEPEVQALQDAGLAVSASGHLTVWLTMHTYAQMLLWPFGDGTAPPNEPDVARVADATCAAIMDTFDTTWECGNAYDTLYATSGTTRDWATGGAGALYSYTAELRGEYFIVEPTEIQPSFEEMWNGLRASVDEVIAIEESKGQH